MSDSASLGSPPKKPRASKANISDRTIDASLRTSSPSHSSPCDRAERKLSNETRKDRNRVQTNCEGLGLPSLERPLCVDLQSLSVGQDDWIVNVSEGGREVQFTGQPRPKESGVSPRTLQTSIVALPLAKVSMSVNRLFIASLGNPPPYSSTRHSAGHVLLKTVQNYLQLPTFQKSKTYANGLVSIGADVGRPEYTLWQSPSLMNVSGVALLKAYKTFTMTAPMSANDPLPGLVVLYDEMETAPSQLKLRRGATSAKGHNGLKSVQQALQSAGLMNNLGDRFVKIGIGIGRPAGGSRSSDDVSKYVLAQFTSNERQAIDGKVAELVQMLEAETVRPIK